MNFNRQQYHSDASDGRTYAF